MTQGQQPDGERTRDAATILPFVASILLMPPLLGVFAAPVTVSGIPLIIVYVFAVWIAIIGTAFLLARKLSHPALGGAAGQPREGEDQR
jgi:hypothetical protein